MSRKVKLPPLGHDRDPDAENMLRGNKCKTKGYLIGWVQLYAACVVILVALVAKKHVVCVWVLQTAPFLSMSTELVALLKFVSCRYF